MSANIVNDKENLVYTYREILLCLKRKEILVTCYNMRNSEDVTLLKE